MDPLSIIAAIAGISQAGFSLSRAIFKAIRSVRGAPKEVADIVRGISDLSCILSEIRRILRDGYKLFRRKLMRKIQSVIRGIRKIHGEVAALINIRDGIGQLMWAFRRSPSRGLLYQIDAGKNFIKIILQTMTLSLQIIMTSRSARDTSSKKHPSDEDDDIYRALRRQQRENYVQAAYQSLLKINDAQSAADAVEPEECYGEASNNQLSSLKNASRETATWVFEVIFSSYAEIHREACVGAFDDLNASIELMDPCKDTLLISYPHTKLDMVRMSPGVVQTHIDTGKVVDELLADWTSLSDDQIRLTPMVFEAKEPEIESFGAPQQYLQQLPQSLEQEEPRQKEQEQPQIQERLQEQEKAQENRQEHEVKVPYQEDNSTVHFVDAFGKVSWLPYYTVKTWNDTEEHIHSAIIRPGVVRSDIMEGRYDLMMNGKVVNPRDWKRVIKPGAKVETKMWPFEPSK